MCIWSLQLPSRIQFNLINFLKIRGAVNCHSVAPNRLWSKWKSQQGQRRIKGERAAVYVVAAHKSFIVFVLVAAGNTSLYLEPSQGPQLRLHQDCADARGVTDLFFQTCGEIAGDWPLNAGQGWGKASDQQRDQSVSTLSERTREELWQSSAKWPSPADQCSFFLTRNTEHMWQRWSGRAKSWRAHWLPCQRQQVLARLQLAEAFTDHFQTILSSTVYISTLLNMSITWRFGDRDQLVYQTMTFFQKGIGGWSGCF